MCQFELGTTFTSVKDSRISDAAKFALAPFFFIDYMHVVK